MTATQSSPSTQFCQAPGRRRLLVARRFVVGCRLVDRENGFGKRMAAIKDRSP
jgi:hypothetical protein